MNQPDENSLFHDEIAHLARLALTGRSQDIQLYITRIARKARHSQPQLAERLVKLLGQAPTPTAPLRGEKVAVIPVDTDSRLQLLRVEQPIILNVDPIWEGNVLQSLEQLVGEQQNAQELMNADLLPARSALFTGPPGVGKTLAAKWIAHTLNVPLLVLDLSAVMSSFLGRTGVNVRNVLDYAKGVQCVLLLDEFDALAKRRDDSTEIGELKRLVTVLLQEIEDWPSGNILIAATNHTDLLDPAIWRRFDVVLAFPMPTKAAVRQQVSQLLAGNLEREEHVELLCALLAGRSFSDIERELKRLRRQALVRNVSIGSCIEEFISEILACATRAKRTEVALLLSEAGISQRKVQSLTGVSRDTIRKTTKRH